MSANRRPAADGPIGVFDSGVGGLSVVRGLLAELPAERLYYVADSANCPYGPRSEGEIQALSEEISRFLIGQGAKLIVVACNTASAAALAHLRAVFPATPFVGMVPAVKPAAQITHSGAIGVLATPATFSGRLYQEVVEHYASGARVVSQICPGLVECVEAGDLDGPQTMALLRGYVEPLLAAGADTLVLGCTHYPFLTPALRRIVGEAIAIIEPSAAIARQAARVLEREGLLRPAASAPPQHVFATTGDPAQLTRSLRRLLGVKAEGQALRWEGRDMVVEAKD